MEFWNRVFCEKIPSGELIFRPLEDSKGCCYVRGLCPKSTKYKDWLGSSCSLGIDQTIQFCARHRRFRNFMMLSNIGRNEIESRNRPRHLWKARWKHLLIFYLYLECDLTEPFLSLVTLAQAKQIQLRPHWKIQDF
jgi:hypothetical protein